MEWINGFSLDFGDFRRKNYSFGDVEYEILFIFIYNLNAVFQFLYSRPWEDIRYLRQPISVSYQAHSYVGDQGKEDDRKDEYGIASCN